MDPGERDSAPRFNTLNPSSNWSDVDVGLFLRSWGAVVFDLRWREVLSRTKEGCLNSHGPSTVATWTVLVEVFVTLKRKKRHPHFPSPSGENGRRPTRKRTYESL